MANPQAARWPAADNNGGLMRALGLFVLVAACSASAPDIVTTETDPAVMDALADPIMADPRLALQDRGGAIGVPTGIDGGAHAQTLGQIAAARATEAAFAGCSPKIDYAFAWMARLPAELPLPAGATVSEAAGSTTRTCNLRIVRFSVPRPAKDVAAFYRMPGFSVTTNDQGVRGARAADGAAFWVSIAATGSATSVDFVTNRGS